MRTIRLFSMAALALVMAACSNDDNVVEQPAQQQGTMHFTATIAAPNSGATTRTTYTESGTSINVAWKAKEAGVYEGDQIALVHNGVKNIATVTAVDGLGNATISATITGSPTDNDDVVLVYPAAAVGTVTSGTTYTPDATTAAKVLTQDGTLEYIQNNIDFRTGPGKLTVPAVGDASLKANVSMPSTIAIWKLSLQDATPTALNATTAVTVKVGSTTVAAATSTAKSDYYLCLVPATMGTGDLTIEATVGTNTYTYTKAGGLTLTAGNYYQSTVTMAKSYKLLSAATNSDYGKVVCAAGHLHDVKTAVPAGCTAVGILGKVTDTGHGLILALQDATSQSWNTIDGWTSVDTYASTTLKKLPDNAARGSLTSYTKLGSTTVSDWAVAQKSDYEAIFENLGSTNNDDGWTYDANVNAFITGGGGTSMVTGEYDYYLSATFADPGCAWAVHTNLWDWYYVTNEAHIRPVLGF